MAARRSLRTWSLSCGVAALLFGIVLGALIDRDVVVCREDLREIAEPPGWRDWPVVPDLGEYHIDATTAGCIGHGIQCGLIDTELRTDRMCPRGGVSLDGWFNGSIYQHRGDISLRESNGTFVVSASKTMANQDHRPSDDSTFFLSAFRAHVGRTRPVFKHVSLELVSLILCLALLGFVGAGVAAWRAVSRAVRYRDPKRYRPARRDDSGSIVFDDGTPPIPSVGLPGPVLVAIASSAVGSYREAPETRADEIIEGDIEGAYDRIVAQGTSKLRLACYLSVVVSAVLIAVAGGAFFVEALKSIN